MLTSKNTCYHCVQIFELTYVIQLWVAKLNSDLVTFHAQKDEFGIMREFK